VSTAIDGVNLVKSVQKIAPTDINLKLILNPPVCYTGLKPKAYHNLSICPFPK